MGRTSSSALEQQGQGQGWIYQLLEPNQQVVFSKMPDRSVCLAHQWAIRPLQVGYNLQGQERCVRAFAAHGSLGCSCIMFRSQAHDCGTVCSNYAKTKLLREAIIVISKICKIRYAPDHKWWREEAAADSSRNQHQAKEAETKASKMKDPP